MEEAKDDCQSSDWGSTQKLTLSGITDEKIGEESVQNYKGGAGQWFENSLNHIFKVVSGSM